MKFSKDNVEGLLIAGAALGALYVAWRAYRVGADAAASVSDTIDSTKRGAADLWDKLTHPFGHSAPALDTLPSSGTYPEPTRARLTLGTYDSSQVDSTPQQYSPSPFQLGA